MPTRVINSGLSESSEFSINGFETGRRIPLEDRLCFRRGSLTTKLLIRIADKGVMEDRRKNDRNMCADLIRVRWVEEGHSCIEVATLEDISANGVCLQIENSIPVGTPVSIYYPTGKYRGKVKYCKFHPIGYLLGIAFDEGYQWSKSDFEPSHLLELPSLPDATDQ